MEPDPAESRWTEDTVRLVTDAWVRAYYREEDGALKADELEAGRHVLAALAAAGLLLPSGGITTDQYRVVYRSSAGSEALWSHAGQHREWGEESLARAQQHGWPDAEMQTRTSTVWPDPNRANDYWPVYTTPWRAA